MEPVQLWLTGGAFLLATWMNARWRPHQAALNRLMGGMATAFLVFGLASWIAG